MGHIALVAISGISSLASYLKVKSLWPIMRSGTRRVNEEMAYLELQKLDYTVGYQDSSPRNDRQETDPIKSMLHNY